eukprot:Seg3047.1 transcript_id=Seg3047.1/GoldUCD/mRNA.D3Y31 product="hypothetical protein" protein_id=Seg3047.1/GoldUCD/D3Y31
MDMQRRSVSDYNCGFGFPDGETISKFEFTFLTPCASSQERENGPTPNTYLLSQERSEVTKCTSFKPATVAEERSIGTCVTKFDKGFTMDTIAENIGKTNELHHRWSREELTARLISKNSQAENSKIGDATKGVLFEDIKEFHLNVQAGRCTLYTCDEAERKGILPNTEQSRRMITGVDSKVLPGQNVTATECVNGRGDALLQDGDRSLSCLTPKESAADRRDLTLHPILGKGDIKSCEEEILVDAKSSSESFAQVKKEALVPSGYKCRQIATNPRLSGAQQVFDRNTDLRLQSEYLPSVEAKTEGKIIDAPYGCVERETVSFVLHENFDLRSQQRNFDLYEKPVRRVNFNEHVNEQMAFSLHREEKDSDVLDAGSKRDLGDFNPSCSIECPAALHRYTTDRPTDLGNFRFQVDHQTRNRTNCKESYQREQIIARLTKGRTKIL